MIPLHYIPFFFASHKDFDQDVCMIGSKKFLQTSNIQMTKNSEDKKSKSKISYKKEIAPCCLHLSYFVISFFISNAKYSSINPYMIR